MSHDHHHGDKKLGVAFAMNLAFTVIEIGAGLWTNSFAILTDALHDAGDSLSLGLAWYLQRYSRKGSDAKFTYGYRRFSSVGALVTSLVLIIGLSVVMWHAVERLSEPEEVNATGMLGFAVLGVLVNGAAAWNLRGGQSLNEKVASWHLLEDTLGWVAVLIGSAVMTIWDLPIIDPILALGISLFIIMNVLRNLKKVALVFLQATPSSFDPEIARRDLADIAGVLDSHHTHSWTLDGENHVLSTHLVMAATSSREQVLAAKSRVHELFRDRGFIHLTVDVELEGEPCGAEASESC